MDKSITRIQNFDIARTFAILCVIMCHCIGEIYFKINFEQLSIVSQMIRIIFFTIGRLGVPIFLFLTGALTLKKQIETDEDVIKFYKKNLLPLFIAIEIWNIIYNLFNWYMTGKFNIVNLLKDLLFFKQVSMPHMWYMPMVLGMYIAIPFLAKIVKTFSLKAIKIPMIIVFIVSILLPSVNVVLNIFKLGQYKIIVDLSFLGRSLWIIYIIRLLYE